MAVALRRAAHQIFDAPLVFDDPLAVAIVGDEAAARLRAKPDTQQERFSLSLRAFVVARARVAEEAIAAAAGSGVTQVVVLGAGLDTFAYRHPGLRVFEVDHPATQAWKRDCLGAAGIAVPSSLTFAPIDFERQTLAGGLRAAGFTASAPAFFSWLGVTMYLTEEAFASTLAFVAGMPRASGVTFDYAVSPSSLGWRERLALSALSRRVARAGEPFQTFFSPAGIRERLAQAGFTSVQDLGADDLNARYFGNRADRLRVSGSVGRVMTATRL